MLEKARKGKMKNISVWGVISYILIGVGTVSLFIMGEDTKSVTDWIGLVAIAFACIGDLIKFIQNKYFPKENNTSKA